MHLQKLFTGSSCVSIGLNTLAINPLRAELILGYVKMYLHFLAYLNTEMAQVVEILPDGRQGPFYPTHYHVYWWPGNGRSQAISSHGIDNFSWNIFGSAQEELMSAVLLQSLADTNVLLGFAVI